MGALGYIVGEAALFEVGNEGAEIDMNDGHTVES
jgi:hypothetical protein